MKPDSMDQAAWDIIFANLANGVGETWGDYITTLSENASYLYTHAGKKVDSTNQLMHFEMLQAVGHSPISVLGSEHDITVRAPGMDINFSRQYRNSISSRYTSGPLGKGWTHNYQLSIEEEADGNVILHAMNSRLRYTLDSRGGYFPPAGNYTKLSKNSDVFTITTSEGTKLVFNIDGTLNYIEDL